MAENQKVLDAITEKFQQLRAKAAELFTGVPAGIQAPVARQAAASSSLELTNGDSVTFTQFCDIITKTPQSLTEMSRKYGSYSSP